jgi:hypothetical protein
VAVDLFGANGQPVAVAQVTHMLLNRQRAKKIRQFFTSVPIFPAGLAMDERSSLSQPGGGSATETSHRKTGGRGRSEHF